MPSVLSAPGGTGYAQPAGRGRGRDGVRVDLFRTHPEPQTLLRQHGPDFAQRGVAEVLISQKLGLAQADQIAQVSGPSFLQAIAGPHGQLELADRRIHHTVAALGPLSRSSSITMRLLSTSLKNSRARAWFGNASRTRLQADAGRSKRPRSS